MLLHCNGGNSTSLEQACSAYANIYRTRETTCYGVAPEPDESTLISREVKSCVLASSAPGSNVGADYWSACASAANNNCGGYKCATYPAGDRQTGEPCLASEQCASLWCAGTVVTAADGSVLSQALQCGACSPRLTEGSPCNLATDACEVACPASKALAVRKAKLARPVYPGVTAPIPRCAGPTESAAESWARGRRALPLSTAPRTRPAI
jgi:hypothetical protein